MATYLEFWAQTLQTGFCSLPPAPQTSEDTLSLCDRKHVRKFPVRKTLTALTGLTSGMVPGHACVGMKPALTLHIIVLPKVLLPNDAIETGFSS